MKNKKLLGVLAVLVLFGVILFLYKGNGGNNFFSRIIENASKGNKENIKSDKQISTGENNKLEFSKKEIKEFKTFQEKVTNYELLLTSMVKSFCKNKKDVIEVTCSSSYFVNEPRFYGMIYTMYSKNNLEYDKLLTYIYQLLKFNCSISDADLEVLFRKIKLNDNTCYKSNFERYKKVKKKLLNKLNELDKISFDNIDKVFNIYYYNKWNYYIPDVEEKKLQILILSGINKKIEDTGLSVKEFSSRLMSYYKVASIDNLKQKILSKYENIFKKYRLEECKLKIDGYKNYFIWGKIRKDSIKCLKTKLNQEFNKEIEELLNLIAGYTYLSKDFLGAKFRAEASFGPEGVGLVNLLNIYALSKGN